MEKRCRNQAPLCTCIEGKDICFLISHLDKCFQFRRYELDYRSLHLEEERRLCRVGSCRVCGGRLCEELPLPASETGEALLETIYHWLHRGGIIRQAPEDAGALQGKFLALFHQEDLPFVVEWLNRRQPGETEGRK